MNNTFCPFMRGQCNIHCVFYKEKLSADKKIVEKRYCSLDEACVIIPQMFKTVKSGIENLEYNTQDISYSINDLSSSMIEIEIEKIKDSIEKIARKMEDK